MGITRPNHETPFANMACEQLLHVERIAFNSCEKVGGFIFAKKSPDSPDSPDKPNQGAAGGARFSPSVRAPPCKSKPVTFPGTFKALKSATDCRRAGILLH